MQPYRIDHRKLIGSAAVISILSSYLMTKYLHLNSTHFVLAPSGIIVLLTVSWILFDKFLWKWKFARWLGLSHVPDLNGKWSGTLQRLGETTTHPFSLEVTQTFSKITTRSSSIDSISYTIKAYFLSDEHFKNFELLNFWLCRTKVRSRKDQLEEFKGISQISIVVNGPNIELNDYYFTDRNPPTAGRIHLKQVKS